MSVLLTKEEFEFVQRVLLMSDISLSVMINDDACMKWKNGMMSVHDQISEVLEILKAKEPK